MTRGFTAKMAAFTFVLGLAGAAQASSSGGQGNACAGLPDSAGFLSASALHIEGVKPLKQTRRIGKVSMERTVGVQLVVRPSEGLTKSYLQRVVNCQVPRELGAVAEGDVPAVRGVVHEQDDKFVVHLQAADAKNGKLLEQLARQALAQRATASL